MFFFLNLLNCLNVDDIAEDFCNRYRYLKNDEVELEVHNPEFDARIFNFEGEDPLLFFKNDSEVKLKISPSNCDPNKLLSWINDNYLGHEYEEIDKILELIGGYKNYKSIDKEISKESLKECIEKKKCFYLLFYNNHEDQSTIIEEYYVFYCTKVDMEGYLSGRKILTKKWEIAK